MSETGAVEGRAVITDTGPLHYLTLIGASGILPALFGAVRAPDRVLAELRRLQTPPKVRAWALAPPAWLTTQATPPLHKLPYPELGEGERTAIALAQHARRGPGSILP